MISHFKALFNSLPPPWLEFNKIICHLSSHIVLPSLSCVLWFHKVAVLLLADIKKKKKKKKNSNQIAGRRLIKKENFPSIIVIIVILATTIMIMVIISSVIDLVTSSVGFNVCLRTVHLLPPLPPPYIYIYIYIYLSYNLTFLPYSLYFFVVIDFTCDTNMQFAVETNIETNQLNKKTTKRLYESCCAIQCYSHPYY